MIVATGLLPLAVLLADVPDVPALAVPLAPAPDVPALAVPLAPPLGVVDPVVPDVAPEPLMPADALVRSTLPITSTRRPTSLLNSLSRLPVRL